MNTTTSPLACEISLYPLDADYVPVIKAFIDQLLQAPGIEVRVNAMATQVFGPYPAVQQAVMAAMAATHAAHPAAMFVSKWIALPLDPDYRYTPDQAAQAGANP